MSGPRYLIREATDNVWSEVPDKRGSTVEHQILEPHNFRNFRGLASNLEN